MTGVTPVTLPADGEVVTLLAAVLVLGISTDPTTYYNRFTGTLGGTSKASIGAIVAAAGSSIAALIATMANIPIKFGESLAGGGAELIWSFTGAPAVSWAESWGLPIEAMTTGNWQWLGIFAPLVMTGIVLGVAYMVNNYRQEEGTDVPLTGINIPFVGADDEEGGQE